MSDGRRPNLLASRRGRRFLFGALYFSEGAPIGFIWWAMPTLLRERGVDVAVIGEMSALLVLPWALKFLWAPLVDTLRSRVWGFRAWIVSAQLMMGLTLIPLLNADVFNDFQLLRWVLILHAVCAATQDVAVDALCIASAPSQERGTLNGWMQAGMLVGRAIFGGVALMLVQRIGLANVLLLMIAAIWMTTTLVIAFTRESEPGATDAVDLRVQGFRASLIAAAASPATWFGLLFAATAAAGFEAIGAFFGPCLTDAGESTASIGQFYLGPVIGLTLVGALIGGWASDRLGKRRFVAATIVALVVAGCLVSLAAHRIAGGTTLIYAALGLLYFIIGLFTASSYALLMDMTDPRLGGTQFSAFMGATNLCESWAVFAGGALAARWGYAAMFAAMSGLSLVGLPILLAMRRSSTLSDDSV